MSPPLKVKHIEEEPPWFEAWGMIMRFSFVQKIYNKEVPLTVVPFICLFKWQAHIIDIPLISIDKQLHIILKPHWLHNTAECTT